MMIGMLYEPLFIVLWHNCADPESSFVVYAESR